MLPNSIMYYLVTKEEVENKVYKRIMETLKFLEKLPNGGYQSLVMGFSGYDDIPDEIYEIMPIREWVEGLFSRCPHLLYFINPENNWRSVMLLPICDVHAIYFGEKKSIKELMDKGVKYEELPQFPIIASINDVKYKNIVRGLKQFGNRVKDMKGANETIKWLDDFFK
jgi:hypothetical protein